MRLVVTDGIKTKHRTPGKHIFNRADHGQPRLFPLSSFPFPFSCSYWECGSDIWKGSSYLQITKKNATVVRCQEGRKSSLNSWWCFWASIGEATCLQCMWLDCFIQLTLQGTALLVSGTHPDLVIWATDYSTSFQFSLLKTIDSAKQLINWLVTLQEALLDLCLAVLHLDFYPLSNRLQHWQRHLDRDTERCNCPVCGPPTQKLPR